MSTPGSTPGRLRAWLRASWSGFTARTLEGRITRATLAISAGTIVLTLGASFLMVRHYALTDLDVVARAQLELLAARLEAKYNRQAQEIFDLAASPLVTNALADTDGRRAYLTPYLGQMLNSPGRYEGLGLVDLNGAVLATTGQDDQPRVAWLDKPLASALEAGNPAAQLVSQGLIRMMVPVTFPPTGTVEGVFHASLIPSHALRFDELAGNGDSALTLATAAGAVIESNVPDALSSGGITIQRQLRLIPPLDSLGITLSVTVSDAQALALSSMLGLGFALAGLMALGITLMASRRIAQRISEPVHTLSKAASTFAARGTGTVDDIPLVGDGEVAVLAETLRAMAEAVSRKHATLEELVEHRTLDLVQARNQLEDILSTVSEAVWSYDAAQGRLTHASASLEKLTGLPLSTMIGERAGWPAILQVEGQPLLQQMIEALRTTSLSHATIEHRLTTQDGTVRNVETKVVARRDDAGRLLRVDGISADISGRVAADERMRLMQRVIESSANGVTIVDNLNPEQPLVYVNPAFERITGYPAIEVLGRNCRLLHAGDGQQPGIIRIRDSIRDGTPCDVVVRNYRKSGDAFWNSLAISPVRNPEGTVTHFVGILSDITDQVAARDELERNAVELNLLFSLSPDGFGTIDGAGNMSFVNQALLAMTGLEQSRVSGLPFDEFVAELRSRTAPGAPFPDLALLPEGEPAGPDAPLREQTLQLDGLQPRILRVALRRAQVAGAAHVLYMRDVTREAEVDRMKSEFLSTAAHELRTPMASILGFSHLLITRDLEAAVRSELYQTIHEQAGRLSNLLNELLDLARIEARAAKEFDFVVTGLGEIVTRSIAGLLVPGDERKVKFSPPSEWPAVRVDPAKFAQALTNVLSNAYKYSPGGGEIELSASQESGSMVVRVRDHGIGMSKDELARAFERFYRADGSGAIPGTGLGLSLVREIMEMHGGSCTIQSEPGRGSTVSLSLPLAEFPATGDSNA